MVIKTSQTVPVTLTFRKETVLTENKVNLVTDGMCFHSMHLYACTHSVTVLFGKERESGGNT